MYQLTKKKVTLVAHSMGGPVTLYFLNHVVIQEWKSLFINAFVPLSAAWAGGNGGLITFVSQISVENNAYLKEFTSSFPTMSSAVWLLLNPHVWRKQVLITTPTKNYTALDFSRMFVDINRKDDIRRFEHSLAINGDYPAPNIPVYCFYGVNISTPESFKYGSKFPETFLNTTFGNSDGAVNSVSSEVCLRWSKQRPTFECRTFPIEHVHMVSNSTVLDAIYKITK